MEVFVFLFGPNSTRLGSIRLSSSGDQLAGTRGGEKKSSLSLERGKRQKASQRTKATMAALLPTILSDDEDSALTPKKDSKKKSKKSKIEELQSDDESRASSGDEMDGDFEFGGMLVSSVALDGFAYWFI